MGESSPLSGVLHLERSDPSDSALIDAADSVIEQALDTDPLVSIRRLSLLSRRLEAAMITAVNEAEASNASVIDTGLDLPAWLSNNTGQPKAKTKGLVRAAKKLAHRFTELAAAVESATIGVDHVHAVLAVSNRRIEADLIGLQPALIELARTVTFSQFQRHLRNLACLLDQDGPGPETERRRSRLKITYTPDGIAIDGHIVGSLAGIVANALNSTADRMYRDALKTDEEAPGRAQLLASALVDICRKGIEQPNGSPLSAEISLIVEADDPHTARTPDEIRIAGETLEMFKCDAVWRVMTTNGDGQPLGLGRAQRLASDAQRRAARLRDKQCAFPGCDVPPEWTDVHHVRHWTDGGTTDIENLVCLCRRHHTLTHTPGWNMTPRDNGTWQWTTPDGRTLCDDDTPTYPWSATRS